MENVVVYKKNVLENQLALVIKSAFREVHFVINYMGKQAIGRCGSDFNCVIFKCIILR